MHGVYLRVVRRHAGAGKHFQMNPFGGSRGRARRRASGRAQLSRWARPRDIAYPARVYHAYVDANTPSLTRGRCA